MKKSLFIFAILITQLSIAQISILWDDDPGVVYSGDTINVDKTYSGFDIYMHCQNTSSSSVEIKFRRVIMTSTATFSDQFCDNNLCYSCSGSDWTSPVTTTLQAGDSSLMKPVMYFSTAGTASIRYYVLDHNDIKLDSVDININCTVGVSSINDIGVEIYPNPVGDNFNINIPNNIADNIVLSIYNSNGKLVINKHLNNGINQINVESLCNGVYYYKLIGAKKALLSDQLLIQR